MWLSYLYGKIRKKIIKIKNEKGSWNWAVKSIDVQIVPIRSVDLTYMKKLVKKLFKVKSGTVVEIE